MKLVGYTISRISLLLIPFVVFGSVLTYHVFKHILYDEIDEFLNYEKDRILSWHDRFNDVPDVNSIVRVYEVDGPFTPFFADTLLLETGDMEMVPHRELHFSLTHDERHLGVVLRHMLIGTDDIIEGAALLMSGITLLMVLLVLVGITGVTRSVWKPFFDTINRIKTFSPDKSPDVLPEQTVFEFNLLNQSLNQMNRKIWEDYNRTKAFNENAAHELQTQLALIKSASEQLPDRLEEDEEGLKAVQSVHEATTRLSYMLRSLLLLSKIGNQEFPDRKTVVLNRLTEKTLDYFTEVSRMRELRISLSLQEKELVMDPGLANLLVSNLIKNAIVHNVKGGWIRVELRSDYLLIENTGEELHEPAVVYLSRFKKGKNGNMGLGLAIVSEICRLYKFRLDYEESEGQHKIMVWFEVPAGAGAGQQEEA